MSWALGVTEMSASLWRNWFFPFALFLPKSSAFGGEALYELVMSANLCPKPEVRNTIYFGYLPNEDGALSTAPLDSEELVEL